jgi:hypothetical protein
MKNLEEKKLLVKMARMLGEPVDPELLESIKREEQLTEALFGKKNEEPVLVEVVPEPVEEIVVEAIIEPLPPQEKKPAETGVQHLNVPDPEEGSKVAQTAKYLDKLQRMPPSQFKNSEMEAIRKTVAELLNRVNTLSFGGGGTGVVRLNNLDDFDQNSYAEGRYLRWTNGMFRLDELTAADVNNNTILVNNNEYYVLDDDWYIGVNYPGTVTIHLPATASNGRNLVIKDESGNCANNPIIATGTVDNDSGGFNLQINNGAIHMVYRSGWRII